MKKNKWYFIVTFIILAFAIVYNIAPDMNKAEKKGVLASIDKETVDRKDILDVVSKTSGKKLKIRVNDEDSCDVIVKYKSSITDEQLKNYKVVDIKDDYIVPITKKENKLINIDLNNINDTYFLVGNDDIVNFIKTKINSNVLVYKEKKDTYKLVKKEDVFNGFVHFGDLTKKQLSNLNILNVNGRSYLDKNYPLKDQLCILIKNEGSLSKIDIQSIKNSIKLNTEEKR